MRSEEGPYGKVDAELGRVMMVTTNKGDARNSFNTAGPRLPPAYSEEMREINLNE